MYDHLCTYHTVSWRPIFCPPYSHHHTRVTNQSTNNARVPIYKPCINRQILRASPGLPSFSLWFSFLFMGLSPDLGTNPYTRIWYIYMIPHISRYICIYIYIHTHTAIIIRKLIIYYCYYYDHYYYQYFVTMCIYIHTIYLQTICILIIIVQ